MEFSAFDWTNDTVNSLKLWLTLLLLGNAEFVKELEYVVFVINV
jgi:hypothetical protein